METFRKDLLDGLCDLGVAHERSYWHTIPLELATHDFYTAPAVVFMLSESSHISYEEFPEDLEVC